MDTATRASRALPLDEINDRLAAVVPQHEYRGFACRFTGLKGRMQDTTLVGQLIAYKADQRFVVCVPNGYIGPYERGDTFETAGSYDFADIDPPGDTWIREACALLERRLLVLHRLIDQVLDNDGV